jgi:aminoglycoside phosphotransferase (APT) family kinase protein
MHEKDILRIVQQCTPYIAAANSPLMSPDESICHSPDNSSSATGRNDVCNHIAIHDASDLHIQTMCSLWAGMGHIYKIDIPQNNQDKNMKVSRRKTSMGVETSMMTMIIKHIVLPKNPSNQTLSNQRKTDSYYVEANFYEKLAPVLISKYNVSVPIPYLIERPSAPNAIPIPSVTYKKLHGNEMIIAMSYIENDRTKKYTRKQQRDAVLTWLANFHAVFWGTEKADEAVRTYGLQPEGSYWYLNTRPDEHNEMSNTGWMGRLKLAARAIADYLQHRDPYQCIIHGDAKEANIIYATTESDNNQKISTCMATFVDFQYCGKGSFTKDLVYYLMRFDDKDDDNMDDAIEFYLMQLSKQLPSTVIAPTLEELQISLSLAYCDLYRFTIGWGNWGSNNRPNHRVVTILNQLDNGIQLHSEDDYDAALRRVFG